MNKEIFKKLFSESISEDQNFQDIFKENVKSSIKEMLSNGEMKIETETEQHGWHMIKYLNVKVTIDNEEVYKTSCQIKDTWD